MDLDGQNDAGGREDNIDQTLTGIITTIVGNSVSSKLDEGSDDNGGTIDVKKGIYGRKVQA